MSNVIITLGGVAFQDFEVPEKIVFGGGQRLVVHQLIGGGRSVDALGNDDGEIVFSGIFSSTDAARRAQALDAARALGAAIPLVWDCFFYSVIIAEFIAEYRKPWWIPFVLRCVVVGDPVAQLAALVAPFAELVGNDLTSAISFGGQAGISLNGLSGASVGGFAAAQTSIESGIRSGGIALTNNSAAINVAPDATTGVTSLNQLTATSSQLAALTAANGYINRAASNSANELS